MSVRLRLVEMQTKNSSLKVGFEIFIIRTAGGANGVDLDGLRAQRNTLRQVVTHLQNQLELSTGKTVGKVESPDPPAASGGGGKPKATVRYRWP